jgi:putative colanic acid biosynthesis UDP-glucose lipid carrier transferase
MERASLLDVTEASTIFPEVPVDLVAADGTPALMAIVSQLSPLNQWHNRFLKRGIDLLVSTVFILAVFPWLLPLAAILIRLDSRGPVFFRQRRHKKNGAIFHCYKLRTMILNVEADSRAAFDGDTRITRIGSMLRRTHLDELPQLLNVWLGDMSLVGPRPHMLSENEQFAGAVPGYNLRHEVKPGITGLAQVRGYVGATNDTAAIGKRLHADLFYIRHWSPAMDSRILWGTLSVFFQKAKQRRA